MKNDSTSQKTIESVLQQEQQFQEEKKQLTEKAQARIAQKQKQLQQQIRTLQSEYVAQSQEVTQPEASHLIDQTALEKKVKEVLKKKSKQVTETIVSFLPA